MPDVAGGRNVGAGAGRVAAAGVVRRPVAFVEVGCVGGVGPRVAIDGDLAIAIKIVECDVFMDERVLVGGNLFAEDGEGGIAVGALDVAEYLVVGSVLFDDVDDVFDLGGYAYTLRGYCCRARRAGLVGLWIA